VLAVGPGLVSQTLIARSKEPVAAVLELESGELISEPRSGDLVAVALEPGSGELIAAALEPGQGELVFGVELVIQVVEPGPRVLIFMIQVVVTGQGELVFGVELVIQVVVSRPEEHIVAELVPKSAAVGSMEPIEVEIVSQQAFSPLMVRIEAAAGL
jgi:hypothetical protein